MLMAVLCGVGKRRWGRRWAEDRFDSIADGEQGSGCQGPTAGARSPPAPIEPTAAQGQRCWDGR